MLSFSELQVSRIVDQNSLRLLRAHRIRHMSFMEGSNLWSDTGSTK